MWRYVGGTQAVEERRLGLPTVMKLEPYTEGELAARQLVFIDDWVPS